MHLAPVVLCWIGQPDQAIAAARKQSATTHQHPAAVEGCALLAAILVDAITTGDKLLTLRPRQSNEPSIAAVAEGSWRGKDRNAISSSGYVAHTLQAALWCVDQADEFAEAVLLAANLADDADTVAAVTGQIAGALWGRNGIPVHWLNRLAWREVIERKGRQLIAAVNTNSTRNTAVD
jgi:ADP-ribosyl-[dinitrogen reductase] hydrolase